MKCCFKKSLSCGLARGLFLLCIPLPASARDAWTLEQCIDTALANNRNVKRQNLSKETRNIAYEQARMDLLPNLNASTGQSFSYGLSPASDNTLQRSSSSSRTSFDLSGNITLFDGLRMKHNIDARRADLYASEADLEKIKEDIILNVSTAFLQVLMNRELSALAGEQLTLTQTNIVQRKALVESGRIAEGELFELQAQEAKEELSRVQAENALRLSLLDLAQIVELDDFQHMDVAVPQHPEDAGLELLSPEAVYRNALASRPEIKSSEYKLQSSEKNVAIARSAYYPRLSFGASLSTGYYDLTPAPFANQLSENMSASLGFTLSIPVFNKFETRNRVRSAQLEVENGKLEMENTKIALRKTIQQAYQSALAAQARWAAALKSEEAAQEAFRFAGQKYAAGRAAQYELFQAKNNLAQALSEKTQAKYEYVFRTMILEIYNK